MKDQILKLRQEGKTYNEIKSILGCSKGTISYYLGKNQKEKTDERRKRRRKYHDNGKVDSPLGEHARRVSNEHASPSGKLDNTAG